MIIACARRSGQDGGQKRTVTALPARPTGGRGGTGCRFWARVLCCASFWWVGWRDVAGEPAQSSHTYGVEHAGGTIAIHDRAPALPLGPRLSAAALSAARELPERLGVGLPSAVAVVVAGDAHTFA